MCMRQISRQLQDTFILLFANKAVSHPGIIMTQVILLIQIPAGWYFLLTLIMNEFFSGLRSGTKGQLLARALNP